MEQIAFYIVAASSVIGILLALAIPNENSPYKSAQYSRKKGDRHDD